MSIGPSRQVSCMQHRYLSVADRWALNPFIHRRFIATREGLICRHSGRAGSSPRPTRGASPRFRPGHSGRSGSPRGLIRQRHSWNGVGPTPVMLTAWVIPSSSSAVLSPLVVLAAGTLIQLTPRSFAPCDTPHHYGAMPKSRPLQGSISRAEAPSPPPADPVRHRSRRSSHT